MTTLTTLAIPVWMDGWMDVWIRTYTTHCLPAYLPACLRACVYVCRLFIAIAGTAAYELIKLDLVQRKKDWFAKHKADEATHGPRQRLPPSFSYYAEPAPIAAVAAVAATTTTTTGGVTDATANTNTNVSGIRL